MDSTTTTQTNHGAGNWIAFLFGAVFNILASADLGYMLQYTLQAVIGGIVCLLFKILGDVLSPLWKKHKNKIERINRIRGTKRIRRHGKG